MDEILRVDDYEFRVKKMNALELLALRSQISFNNYDDVMNLYSLILEKAEVNCKDKWLPVKDGNTYYPASIENNVDLMNQVIAFVLKYLKSVFMKSNE